MTSQRFAARHRRALAAVGAVGAGLLVLSACDKPTPLATVTVGSSTVNSEASCYDDGKALKPSSLQGCLKDKDAKSIKISDPDSKVRFGVDPEVADHKWTILMNGQALSDASDKTYRAIPASVFFNQQYGATGKTTTVTVLEGSGSKAYGLWTFKLEKDF
ncbi:DUF2771 domain-containing protein [Streptomyces sp. VRA16 Mangrove soil]|uniref:DUF2771 domain-containing protein n=1 Tax=Streptomyces sp. VRA16 Mangrove soil TaxID=2817434 RepID=UPI001A9E6D7E|nr:DUF2771 domain-containing protein [Streptomyces sp. VRA16 Mangrove soil]MBO1337859.1 DUF2771 domain-containing protein [Streptomyces sp. VRA16 Mangrove soil]